MSGCCGVPEEAPQKRYQCQKCGSVSETPSTCCGQPMKKVNTAKATR